MGGVLFMRRRICRESFILWMPICVLQLRPIPASVSRRSHAYGAITQLIGDAELEEMGQVQRPKGVRKLLVHWARVLERRLH